MKKVFLQVIMRDDGTVEVPRIIQPYCYDDNVTGMLLTASEIAQEYLHGNEAHISLPPDDRAERLRIAPLKDVFSLGITIIRDPNLPDNLLVAGGRTYEAFRTAFAEVETPRES